MPRYYFNVRRDQTIFEDQTGIVLPEVGDAWAYALHDARSLVRQGLIDQRLHSYWIEVCDAHRCAVVAVPIGRMTMQ